MTRRKSDEPLEVKALRKLLLSLGLSAAAVRELVSSTNVRLADLSSKACEIEMYISAHPEIARPAAYAAQTLRNYVLKQDGTAPDTVPQRTSSASTAQSPVRMELWGYEERNT